MTLDSLDARYARLTSEHAALCRAAVLLPLVAENAALSEMVQDMTPLSAEEKEADPQ